MDATELKGIWQDAVRRLLSSDTYRVSKSFDGVFEDVAAMLTRNDQIDPVKFVEIQIKYMLSKGLVSKLFPNVLSGERALERYVTSPSPKAEEHDLRVSLISQAQCFTNVCTTMGEDFAFSNRVVEFHPAFLTFMMWQVKRAIPPALRDDARAEFEVKPLLVKFFPPEFLQELRS